MNTSKAIIETLSCKTCGTEFQWTNDAPTMADFWRPENCEPCSNEAERIWRAEEELRQAERTAKAIAEHDARLIVEANEKLDAITPEQYQRTDITDGRFNAPLWKKAQDWYPGPETPWLGLVGVTGACKTRVAFLKFRKLVESSLFSNCGRWPTFAVITSYDLANLVRRQHSREVAPRQADLWGNSKTIGDIARKELDDLGTVDLLLFDDLGKAKNTPSISAELFAIFDRRHADLKTTIWTSNAGPEGIVTGMDPDIAAPLAGRLIECSRVITIK